MTEVQIIPEHVNETDWTDSVLEILKCMFVWKQSALTFSLLSMHLMLVCMFFIEFFPNVS